MSVARSFTRHGGPSPRARAASRPLPQRRSFRRVPFHAAGDAVAGGGGAAAAGAAGAAAAEAARAGSGEATGQVLLCSGCCRRQPGLLLLRVGPRSAVPDGMGRQGKKRTREDGEEADHCNGIELRTPEELPPREASAVGEALQRWGLLRCRVEELRPSLEQEDRLMQEILSRGLGGEDRKTLRKLASGGTQESEDEASQLAAALGPEREKLQDILMRNQRELLELSTSSKTDSKQDLLDEMESVIDELRRAQESVHSELLSAKEREDMPAVRSAGRSLNDLKALTRRLDGERRGLTKNSALAALLVTVCRRVLPVRQIDPRDLRQVSPSYDGYLQILDFYFFSDASLYCFGEHFSGPNWFTRLKRNIAIFMVHDSEGKLLYNSFAVSGENKTPGAAPAPAEGGPLVSIEAEDEHGRVFDRRHDAEFKLLTGFCLSLADRAGIASNARAALWSKKPLCRSCAGAVQQVQRLFPTLSLHVEVGDPNAAANDAASGASSSSGVSTSASSPKAAPKGDAKAKASTSCAAGCAASAKPPADASIAAPVATE